MNVRHPVKGAAAFSKTIAVLQLIADSEQPLTSADLVKITNMPRPTMRRILKALVAEDMVVPGPNKTFTLGARHIELARKSIDQNLLLRTANPELNRLSSVAETSVFIGIPMGIEFIIIGQTSKEKGYLGGLAHFHCCAIAKSYLAFVEDSRREQIINSIKMPSLTPHTPTSRQQLRAELNQALSDGYAVSDQQFRLGEKWLGACLFDANTNPCAGIGFRLRPSEHDTERESKLISALLQCRDRINQKLKQTNHELANF